MVAASRGSGLLVAFEGIDGCGKSTQAERFASWARASAGFSDVHHFREPGGTGFGERVRELLLHGEDMGPLAEMLLYMASRAELYANHVLPALEQGDLVVLDRSYYSTAAYQGAGLGVHEGLILDLARQVTSGREPDRVVLLDVDIECAAERRTPSSAVGGRAATGEAPADDRIEGRGPAYFERVREAYLRYAGDDRQRFVILDGMGGVVEVEQRVRDALKDLLDA